MSEELKNQLEEKRAKAMECRDSFRDFKRSVARNAEYSRTGKRIPLNIIQEIEDFELDKDAEVEEVRGANISLKNRLAKLELQLRKKDELAENLHVIDFEQLKIENQTLNEKIEERHEELHKLRKKTVIMVQVITHMREKLQFIARENAKLKAELARLDQELASQRDLVAKTKHERDDFRVENAKLRQQTGILNSDLLGKDYETRVAQIRDMKQSINEKKQRHRKLQIVIDSANTAEA
jgi:chromosome segregation ATPase